jgi:hypothetical protein
MKKIRKYIGTYRIFVKYGIGRINAIKFMIQVNKSIKEYKKTHG